jgi:multiubiquitin
VEHAEGWTCSIPAKLCSSNFERRRDFRPNPEKANPSPFRLKVSEQKLVETSETSRLDSKPIDGLQVQNYQALDEGKHVRSPVWPKRGALNKQERVVSRWQRVYRGPSAPGVRRLYNGDWHLRVHLVRQFGERSVYMANERERHEITIFVNNQPFKTAEHELTGAQIKALAGIPQEYELFRVEGQQTIPVGNDERVRLHENEHFRAIPSGTFGEKWLCLRG